MSAVVPAAGAASAAALPAGARPVDPDLFDGYPDAPRLVGSRCAACGAVTFPAQGSCPRCTSTGCARHPLATEGTLWSWTVQGFPPKEPFVGAGAPFTPFGVGYVDLGGEVLVESRLVVGDLAELAIGEPMALVLEPLAVAGGDEVVVGFAFTPSVATAPSAGPEEGT